MASLTRDGVVLSYGMAGRGPPVLFIQGAGVIGEGWRPQIDALCDRFTCVWFDNRGIGASGRAPGPLSVEAMAEDALAIADAERLGRFHLVGHSLGGLVAQELALRARARVSSLALLCTFSHGKEGAQISAALALLALRMRIGTRAMRRNAFLELVMPRSHLETIDRRALAETLAPLFGHDLAAQPTYVFQQVRAMARFDARPRLPSLAALRTLVLSASEDRIARPAYGRALAAAIPGAQFVEIEGAGHAVTIQRAAEVNARLADHLARAEAGRRDPGSAD